MKLIFLFLRRKNHFLSSYVYDIHILTQFIEQYQDDTNVKITHKY